MSHSHSHLGLTQQNEQLTVFTLRLVAACTHSVTDISAPTAVPKQGGAASPPPNSLRT